MTEASDQPQGQPQPQPTERAVARWGGRFLVGALLVLVALNVVWVVRNYGQKRPSDPHAAPDFAVRRIDSAASPGSEFRLSAERGHPVLVDFWATWCLPCKESLPVLDQVYARLHDRGLRAIAIETEGSEAKARAMASQLGLKLPIGTDEGPLSEQYGVTAIPYMLLIDGKGHISRIFRGVHSASEIERAVLAAGLQ
ncbi:MAG TPA: TlpA disulfide reductase family protein [Pseudomonadota bacterium]|nr:TlpA disulfide reductase family protein [Pseudomonadota bacterium]